MTYCTCWVEYPNRAHEFKNGHWKCVDKYKNIRQLETIPLPGLPFPKYVHKTKCIRIDTQTEGERMTKENKFKIGLALQGIALMSDEGTYERIKDKLKEIEEIVSAEPDDDLSPVKPQEPCDDAISRDMALEKIADYVASGYADSVEDFEEYSRIICQLPPVNPQEPYDFSKWVAREIFDDMWEYNKDAFAEIACRKLAKLGIVRSIGGEWELVEPQESEEV